MTKSIDELALKVGLAHFDDFENEGKHLMVDTYCINSQLLSFARALIAEYEADQGEVLFVVFDGPPDHNAPRFVEVETAGGCSVKAGEWKPYGDYWTLGPLYARPDPRVKELEAEVAGLHEQLEEPQINSDLLRILEAEKAELERQLAEARMDAERYQTLKTEDFRVRQFVSSSYGWKDLDVTELDVTLDAAKGGE